MKVFVVDSHAIYRRGLAASLEFLDRVDTVDQADDVGGARGNPALLDADVVILDASIIEGRELIASITRSSDAHVIACSSECDDESVITAFEAGAVGYLRKETLTQDMLQTAMVAAESGAAIVTLDFLSAILRRVALDPDDRPPRMAGQRLTDREQRVLTLIADGHPTREVAVQLSYSERTVKNVLHDVVTKLNARSRSQAVAHAVRDGLIWPTIVPPLLNANAVVQCGHGGMFPVVPRGPRPLLGGAPGLTVSDFPGVIAAGCVFNVAGAPVPCVIVGVVAGMCPKVLLGGAPAVNQTLVCATSNGVPSLPVASAGQVTVQG